MHETNDINYPTFQFCRDTRISARILKLPPPCIFRETVGLSMVRLYHRGVPLRRNIRKNALHSPWNHRQFNLIKRPFNERILNSCTCTGCEKMHILPYSWTHDIYVLGNYKNINGIAHYKSVNFHLYIFTHLGNILEEKNRTFPRTIWIFTAKAEKWYFPEFNTDLLDRR